MSSKAKATGTKEEGKPALVPKLQFPEFRDSDDWQTKLLGKLCRIRTGKKDANEGASDGQYPFFTCAENHIFSHSYSFDAEAILIAGNANVGQTRYYRGKFEAYQRTYVLTDFSGISVPYLYAVLNAKLRESLLAQVQVSAMSYIKLPMLQEYALAVPPSPAEQQKIAECLSSVDELTAAQARKVDALETHKKGLMQQLFPRERETQPGLRFPGEGDWTVSTLPEVVFFQEGPGIMAVDFRDEGVPLVRLAGVGGTTVTLNGCNFLDPARVAQKWDHFRLVLDDLIISTSATFGLSSIVTETAEGAVFYTGLIRLRPSNKRLHLGYLQAFLGSPHFARQAESAAVGGGIKHFGPTHLKQMEIPMPPLAEQHRIADCLSSLDALITAETQKLEALKLHKRGLMQQLFPSPEEVEA